jgi:hypothetical protein
LSIKHSLGVAVAIFAVARSAGQPPVSKVERAYSVCEVLADLAALNGKVISVRGTVIGGGHGASLTARCSAPLIVKRFTWPNAIWLELPRSGKPFEPERSALERADAAVRRFRRREGDEIVMTYVGMLQTDDLATRTFVDREGKPAGLGFGHLNFAPAQPIIKTARDVEVRRRSARDKEVPPPNTGHATKD